MQNKFLSIKELISMNHSDITTDYIKSKIVSDIVIYRVFKDVHDKFDSNKRNTIAQAIADTNHISIFILIKEKEYIKAKFKLDKKFYNEEGIQKLLEAGYEFK